MRSAADTAETFAPPKFAWALLGASVAVLLVPSYVDVYRVFWRLERGAQGPVILALIGWLIWRERHALRRFAARPPLLPGVLPLAVGLVLYILGRSQSIYSLEIAAQIPVMLGICWLLWGAQGVRRLWFPIALLVFVVPIPGSMLDPLLLPLKNWVSSSVDGLLHWLGYPIARSGVLLVIGPYRLLIADACSGLNSMVALSGVGLLYVYLADHPGRWRNVALLASILPIAFAANIVRVLLLVLITYYNGEAAGSTFHDHAGVLEVLLAFGAFFTLDRLLGWLGKRAPTQPPRRAVVAAHRAPPRIPPAAAAGAAR
jgi:exosortase B